MTPLLVALDLDDGRGPRATCIGCSKILHDMGMLTVLSEQPMHVGNAPDGTYSSLVYGIRSPYTLELCRSAIRERHVGPPEWGA